MIVVEVGQATDRHRSHRHGKSDDPEQPRQREHQQERDSTVSIPMHGTVGARPDRGTPHSQIG
jgi:hypothetical protein